MSITPILATGDPDILVFFAPVIFAAVFCAILTGVVLMFGVEQSKQDDKPGSTTERNKP